MGTKYLFRLLHRDQSFLTLQRTANIHIYVEVWLITFQIVSLYPKVEHSSRALWKFLQVTTVLCWITYSHGKLRHWMFEYIQSCTLGIDQWTWNKRILHTPLELIKSSSWTALIICRCIIQFRLEWKSSSFLILLNSKLFRVADWLLRGSKWRRTLYVIRDLQHRFPDVTFRIN